MLFLRSGCVAQFGGLQRQCLLFFVFERVSKVLNRRLVRLARVDATRRRSFRLCLRNGDFLDSIKLSFEIIQRDLLLDRKLLTLFFESAGLDGFELF